MPAVVCILRDTRETRVSDPLPPRPPLRPALHSAMVASSFFNFRALKRGCQRRFEAASAPRGRRGGFSKQDVVLVQRLSRISRVTEPLGSTCCLSGGRQSGVAYLHFTVDARSHAAVSPLARFFFFTGCRPHPPPQPQPFPAAPLAAQRSFNFGYVSII